MNAQPLALAPVQGPVFYLDEATLQQGIAASRGSPRGRIMLPLHRSAEEGVQRLLNFVQPGSYIRPHLHPLPECVENIAVLSGAIGFLVYDEGGKILSKRRLAAGQPDSCMVDIEQGVWHTFVALAADTMVLEIKRGPYNASTDKKFAPWAPVEGNQDASGWLAETVEGFEPKS
jgi:cupin fold WbuC family metalloprotein